MRLRHSEVLVVFTEIIDRLEKERVITSGDLSPQQERLLVKVPNIMMVDYGNVRDYTYLGMNYK